MFGDHRAGVGDAAGDASARPAAVHARGNDVRRIDGGFYTKLVFEGA
jgi:hypothetical protein